MRSTTDDLRSRRGRNVMPLKVCWPSNSEVCSKSSTPVQLWSRNRFVDSKQLSAIESTQGAICGKVVLMSKEFQKLSQICSSVIGIHHVRETSEPRKQSQVCRIAFKSMTTCFTASIRVLFRIATSTCLPVSALHTSCPDMSGAPLQGTNLLLT